MRSEIRIVQMTQAEYEEALKKFLGVNYESEKSNYWDYIMEDFSEVYLSGMEIANADELGTQYYAVITDSKHYDKHDGRLYELPESFVNELKNPWEDE